MNPIPDVFVIGAMKSGTTSFYDLYFQHPEINLTKSKEHNGFVNYDNIERIRQSYKGAYKRDHGITCDISPKYSQRHLYPNVADKIAQANPRAKIIYLVRDPIERMLSHIYHDMLRDRIGAKDIQKILADPENQYVQTSRYFYQIEPFLQRFPKDQLMVLNMPDLVGKKQVTEERIGAFLSIPGFRLKSGRSYESSKRYKIFFFDFIHGVFGESILTKWYHLVFYALNIKPSRPVLRSDQRNHLRALFNADVAQLKEHFSLGSTNWRYFSGHE